MDESALHAYGAHVTTSMVPVVAVIMVAISLLILFGSRRSILPLVLAGGIIIPFGQQVVVFGLNLMTLRIIMILGVARILIDSLDEPFQITRLDKFILAWAISSVIVFTLRWESTGAFINKIGFFVNCMGAYFVFRYLVRDLEEVDRAFRILALISLFVAICMLYEQITNSNMLTFLGNSEYTVIRDGKIRSMAGFAHPILAGTFGAVMLPLYVSLWGKGKNNSVCSLLGIFSAIVIILTSASSTPVLSFFAGILALMLWPMRGRMKIIRWGGLLVLISLHLVMKAPVWALISRVDVTGGSSGYHRYKLIDEFINRFGEWWLLGTESTTGWGWDMWDTVNQFVSEGVNGGIITFLLFISIIVVAYKILGEKLKGLEDSQKAQFRIWALGSALFSHILGFFGISYFDQTMLVWYLLLATISLLVELPKHAISSHAAAFDGPADQIVMQTNE